jgi:glycosyltransferase involved in cell wall biosynthesis
MRIVYYIASYGPEDLANEVHAELLLALQALGHELVVSSLTTVGDVRAARQWSVEQGLPVYRGLTNARGRDRWLAPLNRALFRHDRFLTILERYIQGFRRLGSQADLIHVESAYPYGAIAALAQPWVRVPIIPTLRGGDLLNEPEVGYGFARFRVPRLLVRFAFATAVAVRANSPLTAAMARGLGCPPQKISVVPTNIGQRYYVAQGAALEAYRHEQRARLRQHLRVQARYMVLFAGRLLPIKGLETLIAAATELKRRGIDLEVLIGGPSREVAGIGDYGAHLQRLIDASGAPARLIGLIPFHEMREYLAACDLLVAPSVRESLNKTVIEAAAVGTPAVVTRTSGVAYYVEQHASGRLIAPRDPQALADAIAVALTDPAPLEAVRARCAALASEFTAERVARELDGLYRHTLATLHPR